MSLISHSKAQLVLVLLNGICSHNEFFKQIFERHVVSGFGEDGGEFSKLASDVIASRNENGFLRCNLAIGSIHRRVSREPNTVRN